MADFCQQCSIELFDKDFEDLANLITEQEVTNGEGAVVLCEGCGPILVDHNGRCLLHDEHATIDDEEAARKLQQEIDIIREVRRRLYKEADRALRQADDSHDAHRWRQTHDELHTLAQRLSALLPRYPDERVRKDWQ